MRVCQILLILYLVFCSTANAEQASISPCQQEEKVIFSCSLQNKKVVSLCATLDLSSSSSGHLTYRIAVPGKPPEFVYPSVNIKPVDAFSFGHYSYPKGGAEQLVFKVNDYTYILYSEHHVFRDSGSGIVINKSGRQIGHQRCIENTIVNDFYHLNNIGLPTLEMVEIEGFINY